MVLSETASNDYVMDVDVSLPFTQVATDDLRVAVVLPEGATDIRVEDMGGGMQEEEERSRRFTFLDSWYGGGRPVVRLHKRNLAPQQRLRIQVGTRTNTNPRPICHLLPCQCCSSSVVHSQIENFPKRYAAFSFSRGISHERNNGQHCK